MRIRTLVKILPALLLMVFEIGYADAAKNGSWTFQSRSDFSKFKVNGFEVDPSGKIKPGIGTLPLPIPVDYIWSILEFDDATYLGTGDGAKIIRVDSEISDSMISSVWDGEGVAVYALAKTVDGDIVAGVSPIGKILKFHRTENGLEKFDELILPDSYIWRITEINGAMWIATGSGATGRGGSIYRWRNGRLDKIYTSTDLHILSMATDGEKLYAGTQGAVGNILLVTRLEKDTPSVTVIFDPPQEEICDMTFDSEKNLYAIAISNARNNSRVSATIQTPSERENPDPDSEESAGEEEAPQPAPAPAPAGTAMIYRINAGGKVEPWIQSRSMIRSLNFSERGLFVSASELGAIYRVDGLMKSTLILGIDEKNIVTLSKNFIGTGKPAVLHKIVDAGEDAFCRSQVLDAQGPASWGVINFEADGEWEIRTRSGNSSTPDVTWSAWSLPIRGSGLKIESPSAQYLQFEIRHNRIEKSDFIKHLEVTYQVFNRSPRITELSGAPVSFSQSEIQKLARSGPFGQMMMQFAQAVRNIVNQQKGENSFENLMSGFAGSYLFSWKAEDQDRDRLISNIVLLDEEFGETIPIISNYSGTAYLLNSALYSDGYYLLRVKVSDRLDNDEESSSSSDMTSERFLIDNTAPNVSIKCDTSASGEVIIYGSATDSMGRISALYYLDENGRWQSLKSEDGICDESLEYFRVIRRGSGWTFTVKAVDQSGNVRYAKIRL